METLEVRYFIETAKVMSIRKASEMIGISPSAISKAISRLESELETKLVEKVGRVLVLTDAGKKFVRQGAEFLALERQIVENHNKLNDNLEIRIVGPELPLSCWGAEISKKILQKYSGAKIAFNVKSNEDGLKEVDSFNAELVFFSSKKKVHRDTGLIKKVGDFSFKTFVSKKHPLFQKRKISVNEVLNERFALTNFDAFSLFTEKESQDGWRDDKFQRKNLLITNSLKALESILIEGLAISYLPDFYGKKLGLKELKISDCPYSCSISVYLCRNKYGLSDMWELL